MNQGDERPPEIDGPPRRTSPLTLVLNLSGAVLVLVILLPSLFNSGSRPSRSSSPQDSPVFLYLVFAALGFQLLFNVLAWFARTYTVGQLELVIDEGILNRKRKVVPFKRVQQVDINQKLIPQVLGLAQLQIDTAGEGGSSVKLGMLDVKLARGIRRFILQRRAELQGTLRSATPAGMSGPQTTVPNSTMPGTMPGAMAGSTPWAGSPGPLAPEMTLLHLGPGRLALAGLTHHSVIIGIPAILVLGLWIAGFAALANRQVAAGAALGIAVVGAIGLGALFAVLSALQYSVGQYGFTLAEQGDDLHLRFGLLQVRNLTIPRRRVQHITVVDNPIRRALGIVAVSLHSAAPLTADPNGVGTARFEIPILPRDELDAFLHALMGGDWHVPELTPRTLAAKRRAITRRVLLIAILMVPPALALLPGSLLMFGFALFGIPWGLAAHERAGFTETPEIIVLAHGVLRHHVDLLPYSRVQSCSSMQNPLQRWCDVRTLHVNVAGPTADPHLYDMPDRAANDYLRDLPRRSLSPLP